MADNTRIPPHDIIAEEALIGSLLIDGSMIGEVSLSLVDFYHEPMRILFETCLALNERGSSINQITVASELDAQGIYGMANWRATNGTRSGTGNADGDPR